MNVDTQIKLIGDSIKREARKAKWLADHRKVLEPLPDGYMCGSWLDFDNLPHTDVLKVIRAFGGRWSKKYTDGRVDYSREVDGITVRLYRGEPPPSCRMIEVEEIIPAHVVPAVPAQPERLEPEKRIKRMKLVCQPSLAATIAMAAERNGQNDQANGTNDQGNAGSVPDAQGEPAREAGITPS